MFILDPVTLLFSLINFSNVLVASLGFSMYNSMSSANNEGFTSYFPSGFFLFLFLLCHGSVFQNYVE